MNIIVVGAGYVGLVAACCLSNSNHQVLCVENDESKPKLLSQGISTIREAPALDIAYLLHEENARLSVYDPMAMDNARTLLPADVIFAKDIYSAVEGANAAILMTEWQEFIQADWQAVKKKMREPYVIFDGRNALPQAELQALGFNYIGIGRKTK